MIRNVMKPTVKLDMYDYEVIRDSNRNDIYYIFIKIESNTDSLIADISSEMTACDGLIYVEGHRYKLIHMTTHEGQLMIKSTMIN